MFQVEKSPFTKTILGTLSYSNLIVSTFLQMADDYNVDPVLTAAMDAFDFYIVPSLNGDGYEYTWTNVSIRH